MHFFLCSGSVTELTFVPRSEPWPSPAKGNDNGQTGRFDRAIRGRSEKEMRYDTGYGPADKGHYRLRPCNLQRRRVHRCGQPKSELETVKENFLVKKLGLKDGPELMDAINSVIETYGKSERNKYRAVVYYMLTKHFGKESVYG